MSEVGCGLNLSTQLTVRTSLLVFDIARSCVAARSVAGRLRLVLLVNVGHDDLLHVLVRDVVEIGLPG
jgi:hypothetical protein